jgi:hypothetical protein
MTVTCSLSVAWLAAPSDSAGRSSSSQNPADITVAAYYYPCTHPHSRWDKAKYPGFTEWDLIRKAKPRFNGHKQPKIPVWGYQDESKPDVMAQKINAAADYGVDVFIFDWYYYDDGPYLERALDEGFLNAKKNDRLRFALMWANHDWYDIQGYNPADPIKLLYPGRIKPQTWDTLTDLVIQRYFKHPAYWTIDGKPYFSIYEIQLFLESFGSLEAAHDALSRFRDKTVQAGFPGFMSRRPLGAAQSSPGTTPADGPVCKQLPRQSHRLYQVHHGALIRHIPVSDYAWGRDRYLDFLDNALKTLPVPYFPNTTINWDNSPRAHPEADWSRPAAHVVNPAMQGNTPAAFKEATAMIVHRLLASPSGRR